MQKELIYDGFESMSDLERDIYETIKDFQLPAEFQGTLKITITYEE